MRKNRTTLLRKRMRITQVWTSLYAEIKHSDWLFQVVCPSFNQSERITAALKFVCDSGSIALTL